MPESIVRQAKTKPSSRAATARRSHSRFSSEFFSARWRNEKKTHTKRSAVNIIGQGKCQKKIRAKPGLLKSLLSGTKKLQTVTAAVTRANRAFFNSSTPPRRSTARPQLRAPRSRTYPSPPRLPPPEIRHRKRPSCPRLPTARAEGAEVRQWLP